VAGSVIKNELQEVIATYSQKHSHWNNNLGYVLVIRIELNTTALRPIDFFMVIDSTELDDGHLLVSEICVIGAGVAGQTLALSLSKRGLDVLLCESGKRDFDPKIQQLARGQNSGETYYDLDTARLRLYGGTAAIWGGRCAELDPIDFDTRDFVPHSGWPISKADLDPYYDLAFATLGLKRPANGRIWGELNKAKPPFDTQKLDAGLWCFDENGERFTNPRRGELDKVRTLLEATLVELDVSDSGKVRTAMFKNLAGKTLLVKAKRFVLAAGAMETVRLLRGAVPARPDGFGNAHDQLGRYFMEHPHARGGQIVPTNMARAIRAVPRALRVKGLRYAAYLRPSEALQREAGILNSSLSFAPRRHEGLQMGAFRATKDKLKHDLPSTKFWRSFYKNLKGVGIKGREWTDPWPTVDKLRRKSDKFGLYAVIRAEQAPNPDSRLTVSNETDALGMRKLDFHWRLSDLDKRSVRVLMETLDSEFKRLGWGEVFLAPWLNDPEQGWSFDPLISAHSIGGYHHMGGARMGTDIKTSVVDANSKLHESPNLYIASSSVFPTGGWANPTVTIMALAERLGAHLAPVTPRPSNRI
jgi:choline dehydrogenase-like flavoprotein